MYRWIMVVAVGVLAVGVLGAGCGDDGESTASASVTKAQFVKKADAVCADRKKNWEAAVAASKKKLKSEGAAFNEEVAGELITASLLPLMKEELKALEELDVPAGDEKKISKLLETRATEIKKIEQGGVKAVFERSTLDPFYEESAAYGLECPI